MQAVKYYPSLENDHHEKIPDLTLVLVYHVVHGVGMCYYYDSVIM